MALKYSPKIYRKQGGSTLVVADAGEIEVQSGGTINIESGSTIAIQSGGILDVESGGVVQIAGTAAIPDAYGSVYPYKGLRDIVQTATSTQTSLSGYGVTFLTNTSNAEYNLPAITAANTGFRATFIKTLATTTLYASIKQASSSYFFSGALDLCNLYAPYEVLNVVAGSTTQLTWYYTGGLDSTAAWVAST